MLVKLGVATAMTQSASPKASQCLLVLVDDLTKIILNKNAKDAKDSLVFTVKTYLFLLDLYIKHYYITKKVSPSF